MDQLTQISLACIEYLLGHFLILSYFEMCFFIAIWFSIHYLLLYEGTGDIVVDMENQVKANSMRIMVLEEQNGALRNSIAKVLETQRRGPREVSIYA